MSNEFRLKDLGEISECLGITFHHSNPAGSIILTQKLLINNLLKKWNHQDCTPSKTVIDLGHFKAMQLDRQSITEVDKINQFQSIIGSLLYISNCTRPDITFAVNYLCRSMSNPTQSHLTAAKHILRYLKGSINFGIKYHANRNAPLILEGYCDANFANELSDRKSTSGYVFLINGSPVTWKSQKQSTVATSTTEAEYIALYSGTKEAIWLRRFLNELLIPQNQPTKINEDNASCIKISMNPEMHERTKHIDVKYHFIREKIKENAIELVFCPTNDMLADIFTKIEPNSKQKTIIEKLCIINTALSV